MLVEGGAVSVEGKSRHLAINNGWEIPYEDSVHVCVCVTFPSLAIKRRSDEVDEPLCGQ